MSGFFDVFALSILTGACRRRQAEMVAGFAPVAEADVVLVGARDLEPYQWERLRGSEIAVARLGNAPARIVGLDRCRAQEEVYLLLGGSADLHLPGRVVPLDPQTFVRVGPLTRRRLRSGENGARLLMIGGMPGRAYQPQENTPLGGPETLPCPTASTSLVPGSAPAQLP